MRSGYPGILIDTNVLIYSNDPREKTKQHRAIGVLDRLAPSRAAALSVQSLAEFLSVARSELRDHLTADQAVDRVEDLLRTFPVIDLTPVVVLEAARAVRDHQLSYWDAQIWASARLNQIPLVLSEDFADGRTIEGVTFRDPFRPEFDVASLGV